MSPHSLKPGRGPSALGAAGGVIAVAFGVCWAALALWLTADAPFPWPVKVLFPLFGVMFVVAALSRAAYDAYNATQPSRFSEFDVVRSADEPDPLSSPASVSQNQAGDRFCRQCGAGLKSGDRFCGGCGTRCG